MVEQTSTDSDILLHRVVKPQLVVGSGVYSLIDPALTVEINQFGEYGYPGLDANYSGPARELLEVSAFGRVAPDEEQIARQLFGSQRTAHDAIVGYHVGTFAGWVTDDTRAASSSGGITTWLLTQLLESGDIDGVIHLKSQSSESGPLFAYGISRTVEEIREGAKSRYFPGEVSQVLQAVRQTPGRYALVAIPSIAYEVRLLQRVDPLFRERIVNVIGLICGHQKTAHYAEYLGWRGGFAPGTLESIDFRKKLPSEPANSYSTELTGQIDGDEVTRTLRQRDLFGTDWGMGFFKSQFSDFTEDAFNETADFVVGDAWLPRYTNDSRGTNVVIVRNAALLKVLLQGAKRGEVHLDDLPVGDVLRSQASLVRQNVEELPYRIRRLDRFDNTEFAVRRDAQRRISRERQQIQAARRSLSRASHEAYVTARAAGDLAIFDDLMAPYIDRYHAVHKQGVLRRRILRAPRSILRRTRNLFSTGSSGGQPS